MEQNFQENEQHWMLLVLILKKIAENKGISHQAIANKTGLIRSGVTRFFGLKYCPNMKTFILISRAIGVNFYFEDQKGDSDLNKAFEQAMTELGRRPDKLNMN